MRSPGRAQDAKKITFEVASIRPSPPDADPYKGGGWGSTRDGYSITTMPLTQWIMNAYFPFSDRTPDPIRNAPPWLEDRFDVEAKVAPEDVSTWSNQALPAAQRSEMIQGALQALLAERLQLVAHREPVEVDGYALVVSKHGSKLRQITPDLPTSDKVVKFSDGAMGVFTPTEGGLGYWTFYQTSMPQLRQVLQGHLLKPLVDQTGLPGKYHFTLSERHFDPEEHREEDGSDRMDLAVLGLELRPTKVKASVLVIDHIEKPSAN